MFKKKIKCICGKNVAKNYEYCPYCGTPLRQVEEKDKQLDKLTKQVSESFGMPILNSFPFRNLVRKLSKDMEKQMMQAFKENAEEIDMNIPRNAEKSNQDIIEGNKRIGNIEEFKFPGGQGIKINISRGGFPGKGLKVVQPNQGVVEKKVIKQHFNKFSEKESKKYSKLEKQEAESQVRRLSDGIIYDIYLPGVESEKQVMITKLPNSIEIKAISKDKAFHKLLPIPLPIKSHRFKDNKLTIELGS